jgi:hypothetical protein
MSKKLMLLAAGALSGLAFMAIPGIASGKEFVGTCGSGATCTGNIVGGFTEVEDDGGTKVGCASVTGTVTQTHNSSTGVANIKFHGCTGFGFACSSPGQPAGTIATGSLTYHLIRLEPNPSTVPIGMLFTQINTTFGCAGGLFVRTFTGGKIAELEDYAGKPATCGVAETKLNLAFREKAGGPTATQEWETITTDPALGEFDLTVGPHVGGGSDTTTAALKSTTTITMAPAGQTMALDC